MTPSRGYGQYCGLARALEIIGERWSTLIVRDLLLGPKRFTELRAGLPRISAGMLSIRLNGLEQHGVVRRRVLPELAATVVYELTEYGADLDQILLRLGLWGARSLGEPAGDDVFTLDSAILALYTTFRPENALGVHRTYELRYPGGMVVHATVTGDRLTVGGGPHPDADVVITMRGSMKALLSGEIGAEDAIRNDLVRTNGNKSDLELFTHMFHIPAAPPPVEGLTIC